MPIQVPTKPLNQVMRPIRPINKGKSQRRFWFTQFLAALTLSIAPYCPVYPNPDTPLLLLK